MEKEFKDMWEDGGVEFFGMVGMELVDYGFDDE